MVFLIIKMMHAGPVTSVMECAFSCLNYFDVALFSPHYRMFTIILHPTPEAHNKFWKCNVCAFSSLPQMLFGSCSFFIPSPLQFASSVQEYGCLKIYRSYAWMLFKLCFQTRSKISIILLEMSFSQRIARTSQLLKESNEAYEHICYIDFDTG